MQALSISNFSVKFRSSDSTQNCRTFRLLKFRFFFICYTILKSYKQIRQKFNFVRIAKKSTSQVGLYLEQLFIKLESDRPKIVGEEAF